MTCRPGPGPCVAACLEWKWCQGCSGVRCSGQEGGDVLVESLETMGMETPIFCPIAKIYVHTSIPGSHPPISLCWAKLLRSPITSSLLLSHFLLPASFSSMARHPAYLAANTSNTSNSSLKENDMTRMQMVLHSVYEGLVERQSWQAAKTRRRTVSKLKTGIRVRYTLPFTPEHDLHGNDIS